MSNSYKLIVSRYKENLDWVDEFENYQIYNKGIPDLKPIHNQNAIILPNKGREAQTYLYHIVNNYEKLEDILIFTQGNYTPHANYSPAEFKRRALDLGGKGFSSKFEPKEGTPGDNCPFFTLKWHGGPLRSQNDYKLGEWWEKTTGEPYVRSKTVYWGAVFSISKEFILKRSLESYKKILATVDWDVHPLEAHFCERTWFNILNLPLDYEDPLDKKPATVVIPEVKFDLKEFLKDWDVETLSFKKKEQVKKEPKIRIKFKDYETYKQNQIFKNNQKLDSVYVSDEELVKISKDIKSKIEPKIGICHGSRNGYEVCKLKELLNCEVIGTDIANSAKKFGLLQHDFHEIKDEWIGKFDFIYTNSLDHAYDPETAIKNWSKCLSEKGLIYIEHTDDHAGEIDFADCFSADFDDYVRLISKYLNVVRVLKVNNYFNQSLSYEIKNIRVIVASNYWKEESDELLTKQELLLFLDNIGDLMFQDEETVVKCTSLLKENIERYTNKNCPVYNGKYIVSKEDLEDKKNWFVTELDDESMTVSTSGTTTGVPFEYKRWHHAFHKLEWDYHYNVVLDEFKVCENPHILYFFAYHYKKEQDKFITCYNQSSELAMNNHGSSRSPIIHYVNYDMYYNNQEEFFKYLFNYVKENPIDVFFTAAPQINSLCNYIKKYQIKHKIGYLLSNTNERLLQKDANFLFVENNYFDHICDHMKCWDGGSMFFTCKHRNYHLVDNFSWTEEVDGKMVCTDFFNLSSPFVRYWNGDYCRIDQKYKRCQCGRLFREFEFLESRPFSLKGVCLQQIKEKIKALEVPDIRQVRCSIDCLDVVSNRDLTLEEKQKICSTTDKFEFKFTVESHYIK